MIAMLLAREVANRHVVEHAPTQQGRLRHHGISCLDDWGLDTAILSDRSLLSRTSLLLSRSGFVQYAPALAINSPHRLLSDTWEEERVGECGRVDRSSASLGGGFRWFIRRAGCRSCRSSTCRPSR